MNKKSIEIHLFKYLGKNAKDKGIDLIFRKSGIAPIAKTLFVLKINRLLKTTRSRLDDYI